MRVKIDTNGDGMISKDEWVAFQEKSLGCRQEQDGQNRAKELSCAAGVMSSFATGGYARGIRTKAMMTQERHRMAMARVS